MKRFISQKAFLVSVAIMTVFISILSGCGGGGGGSWTEPGAAGASGSSAGRPTVVATIPATTPPGPTLNVPSNSLITVQFSKDMTPATVVLLGAFSVTGPGATPVTGAATAVTYDVVSRTATFHPLAPLAVGVTYTATVKGIGANPVTDLASNALAGKSATPLLANDYVWSFTTIVPDVTLPQVTVTVPVTTTPGPTLNVLTSSAITATFNENMLPATVTAAGAFTVTGPGATPVVAAAPAVTYDVASKTATFHPLSALLAGTTYTATIKGLGATAVTDSAGNALEGKPVAFPLVANDYVWTFTTAFVTPPGNINDLMSYGIASAGGITNSGATKINGNVVLNPLDQCNGVPVGSSDNFGLCAGAPPTNNTGDMVITLSYPDTTTAASIRAQLLAKWNSISPAGTPGGTKLGCGVIGSAGGGGAGIGCAGNSTLPAGTYIANIASIDVSGVLTLNGSATDVWVFQAPSSTVITAVNSSIVLTGGAKASNVWWFVGSSADLKAGSTFQGNILASAAISMGTGSTSCGRLFSGAEGAGAFTFLANTVSVPGYPNAPVGCQ